MKEELLREIKKNYRITSREFDEDILILIEEFKEKAIDILAESPYLLGEYLNININFCKKIFRDRMDLVTFSILFIIYKDLESGNSFIFKSNLIEKVKKFILIKNIEEKELNESFDFLIKNDEIVIENECIYIKKIYEYENQIAKKLLVLDKKIDINHRKVEEVIEKYSSFTNRDSLNKEQKLAVKTALLNQICIINGSAGTGKTTVLKVIIDCLMELDNDLNIKVVSLAGKAVRRVEEVLDTHSGLTSTINAFITNKTRKCNVMIIDECSMVDLESFYYILELLDSNCRLILIGDYEQLPPIGVGQVFKDLIECGKFNNVELKQINRQGKDSIIVKNAYKILASKGLNEKNGIVTKKGEFEFVECKNKDINKEVIRQINILISNNISLYDIQVISSTKKGTNEINSYIGKVINKTDNERKNKFSILDPVVQITNNYKKQVYNGEKGIITYLEKEELSGINLIKVDFGDRQITYKGEELNEIELAYALTVHKMQGSEEKVIILVVSEEFKNLNREMLYVAVTRAKERVIIIGEKEAFNNAVKKKTENRNSKLIERISAL